MPKDVSKPTLVLMAGTPGAGKSTLALALGREPGWPVLDKDTIKVALLEEAVPESTVGPASYYVPFALCRDLLEQQQLSVIFDSPAAYANVVEQAQKITDAAGGTLKIIFCHAPVQVRNQRLAARDRRLSPMGIDPATDEESQRRFAHLPPTALRLKMERPLHELVAEAAAYLLEKSLVPDAEKLCVVDSTFFITGRGPVINTSLWEGSAFKAGDWIELHTADGERNRAQIKSFEMIRWAGPPQTSVGGRYALLLAHIDRSLIHAGDEVWSVADTPANWADN